jgi:hypothetical protein
MTDGKRAGKKRTGSHPGKKKSGRLVAGSLKAREVTSEKRRGQAFLRKLRANGQAWWSEDGSRYLVTVKETERTRRRRGDLLPYVLVRLGSRLRVASVADKSGLLVCTIDGQHAYLPLSSIFGYIEDTSQRATT